MAGAKYWTTLDAASAYWSIPLTESDKEKTAFSVPHGKYEFNVMPYGLSNAGASYQRMIDMCLSAFSTERVLAYIDDINYAVISEPLNKLTCDNIKFIWNSPCESAFKELKQRLTSQPVLAFPKLNETFTVEVDAGDYAAGGVLSQRGDNGFLHPVAYFSTAFKGSQRQWTPITKEAFALVLATKCDTSPPKAPLLPMLIPDAPMQFIAIDVSYMPKTNEGYEKLNQSKWASLLPELVFALNTSESKATKCTPFKVVFGRDARLPIDVLFDHDPLDCPKDINTAEEYAEDHLSESKPHEVFSYEPRLRLQIGQTELQMAQTELRLEQTELLYPR
eukprot:gene6977-biopygen8406